MSPFAFLPRWIAAITFTIVAASCTSSRTAPARQPAQPDHTQKQKHLDKHQPAAFTLSTIGDRPYIGIGLLTDSATHLSRSFALYQLLNDHPLALNGTSLVPLIVDYPFTAPFAVTGTIGGEQATLKFFQNGKKIKEVIVASTWKEMYSEIVSAFTGNPAYKAPKKFGLPDEGTIDKIDARNISDCMPGSIELSVPHNAIIDTFSQHVNIRYVYTGDAYTHNRRLFGKYNADNENKLFFFRNDNVPYNLKNVARPLIFPLYRSMTPSLTYLSSGKTLAIRKDYGASLNSYMYALLTSGSILASPYERAMIRSLAFGELSRTHLTADASRRQTALLFQLGADLDNAYLNEAASTIRRDQYYNEIQKVADLCTKAEDKAREIRGQKRLGGLLAAISYAGALGSVSAEDNTTSDAFMSQAETYFTTSMEQADGVSKALQQQYEDVESKIDTRSFLTGEASSSEISSSVVAGEVYYHLLMNPVAIQPVLLKYAANKPRLLKSVQDFYNKPASPQSAREVFVQMANIETRILNTELRNFPVNETVLATF
jgi:hypothetical protein